MLNQEPIAADEFARRLILAGEAVLTHRKNPWRAVEPFESILEDLSYGQVGREQKLVQVRTLARQLWTELEASDEAVAMEVRHFCWHVRALHDPDGSPKSSLRDMLMTTLTRFAHYQSHDASTCSICAQFHEDLPYQGGAGGREHFHAWLKTRGFDAER